MAKRKIVKSKVVKKKAAKKTVKSKNEIEGKNDTQEDNHIATIKYDGDKYEITKDHLSKNYFTPLPCTTNIHNEVQKASILRTAALRVFLSVTDTQEEVMNDILSELAAGAYQDRLTAYSLALTKYNAGNIEAIRELQKIRQSADSHLLRIIRAIRDIKRPKANLTVREAQQVNVADKQVNVSQKVTK